MNIEYNYIKLSELVYDIENVISDKYKNKTYWIVAETSDIKKYDERRYCFIKLIISLYTNHISAPVFDRFSSDNPLIFIASLAYI